MTALILPTIVITVAGILVIGDALLSCRREHRARVRARERELGRPLTAAELWELSQ